MAKESILGQMMLQLYGTMWRVPADCTEVSVRPLKAADILYDALSRTAGLMRHYNDSQEMPREVLSMPRDYCRVSTIGSVTGHRAF